MPFFNIHKRFFNTVGGYSLNGLRTKKIVWDRIFTMKYGLDNGS